MSVVERPPRCYPTAEPTAAGVVLLDLGGGELRTLTLQAAHRLGHELLFAAEVAADRSGLAAPATKQVETSQVSQVSP